MPYYVTPSQQLTICTQSFRILYIPWPWNSVCVSKALSQWVFILQHGQGCVHACSVTLAFVIPGIVAHQAPLSMEFSRQDPGVSCHFHCTLHWLAYSLSESHLGNPFDRGFCVCVCVCVLVAQLCLTLCNPMDCSSPSSFVHGILQARIL